MAENVDYNIDFPLETTANSINSLLASIVKTLPTLRIEFTCPLAQHKDIKVISPVDVETKLSKVKRTKYAPLII